MDNYEQLQQAFKDEVIKNHELRSRPYTKTVDAFVVGYVTSMKDNGLLLKDVEIGELDKNFLHHIRRMGKDLLTVDKPKVEVDK